MSSSVEPFNNKRRTTSLTDKKAAHSGKVPCRLTIFIGLLKRLPLSIHVICDNHNYDVTIHNVYVINCDSNMRH